MDFDYFENARKKARRTVSREDSDSELKTLAYKTAQVPLEELATFIRAAENDQVSEIPEAVRFAKDNREKQRQLFGMVWLLNSCEASPTAVVPRNRIYARYVQICADNNLTPLSPASFGKLVKILFPKLTTRRLGLRGQSKYHYCGVKLVGDQNMERQQREKEKEQQQQGQTHLRPFSQVHSPISSSNSSVYEDSPVPSVHTPSFTPINSPCVAPSSNISHQLPSVSHLRYVPNLLGLVNNADVDPGLPIQLPSLYPYLSQDTDYDMADTLYSLYRVHVNSLFQAMRFMQVGKLFGCFGNFNGTLTAPVFKLYSSDSTLEWIKQCDVIMYKAMLRMCAKLQFQYQMHAEVLSSLKQIAAGFVKSLSSTLVANKVSKHFVVVKLKLARSFVNMLTRLVKTIETGISAYRILADPQEKLAMVRDWMALDLPEIAQREIPCADTNLDMLLAIMRTDVVNLLNADGNIMLEIGTYIAELPGRFTDINPRLFVLLTSNLLTTCLREISLKSGQGFGAWWIVRCWVDEFLSWCFEMGGLFQSDFEYPQENEEFKYKDYGLAYGGDIYR